MNAVRRPFYLLVPVLLCLGSAQAAEEAAATLMEVTGPVLVNQGKNYQAAQSGMKLAANARVLTRDKAGAVVTSKQGCATRLGPNSLFVVRPADPCHGGATAQKIGSTTHASAGETGGGAAADDSWMTGATGKVLIGAAGVAVVTGGVMGGLAASGGLDSSGDGSPFCISPTFPGCH